MPAEYNYAQDSFQNPSSRVCPQVFALSSPSSRGRYSGNFPRLFRKTNECFSQSFIDTSAWNRSDRPCQSTRERALKYFGDTFFITVSLAMTTHFCCVWCGMKLWIFGRVRRVYPYRLFGRSVLYFSHIIWWEASLQLSLSWILR